MNKSNTPTKKKVDDNLMNRVRASVNYLNGQRNFNNDDREMFTFLSMFHPEMSLEKRFKLIRDKNKI